MHKVEKVTVYAQSDSSGIALRHEPSIKCSDLIPGKPVFSVMAARPDWLIRDVQEEARRRNMTVVGL